LLFSTVVFIKNADPFFCKKFYGNPEKRLPSFFKRKTVQELFCTVFSGRKKDFDRQGLGGCKNGKIAIKNFLFGEYHSSIQHSEPAIMQHLVVLHQTAAENFRNVQDWLF